ncbi:MAG TPA: hypothetical protein VLH10_05995 [Yinghuangia sp.]|uniref:PspA-associated protein PspAB n=1 Tax=Yinghuangia sp. YIM S10712 TaxID=3436930 RepID=UPI002B6826DE|nr:hypothetical protein [Yinghuangia sp.]
MGFWDTVLGRTKPVRPDLDQLFGVPSAAVTLQAAMGFAPTGTGAVCFASLEGAAFTRVSGEVDALLRGADADGGAGSSAEFSRDEYGYSWLTSRRPPDDVAALVNDLHAVNSALEADGFGSHLLCSLVAFRDARARTLALVYLYKRGTFYPFAPLPGDKRDSPLELEVKATVRDDLPIEPDLTRWFPVWAAPGL